ncbi:hypothetical protein ACTXKQ_09300 [Corynebacterium variabile]|uniref:Uncharacterized protein n=1 Tax=Corynebacterium variabile TaxID=1727 RepID=A0A0X2NM88_9CORY|nr:hypothetical protein [Corynebacterium variabile]CUU66584.1 hypothetical protein CVAR292_01931 [Corynebacterium variabile]
MTTQGPYANSPFPAPQGGPAPAGQAGWQQQPNGAQFAPQPPAHRQMGEGVAWTFTFLIPLVVVLGGYSLLHLFFG